MKAKLLIMLAGIAMLAACSGHSTSATDSVMTDSAAVKLIKTADMRIKVKDVASTAEKITKLALKSDCMVMHHTMQSNVVSKQDLQLSNDSIKRLTVYNATAELVIKIPAYVMEPFMDSLNHFGTYIDERKMDIEDRTIDYFATKAKADNRQASVKLRSKIKLTQGSADTILALKDDAVDRQVVNMRTDEATTYSTLNLTLYQNNTIHAEIVANDNLDDYKAPLTARINLSLANGWSLFTGMVVGILNLWVFILTAGGVVFLIIIYRRKKKEIKTIA
jgi:succinate dehydrogenase hydrophobic anchor subunit